MCCPKKIVTLKFDFKPNFHMLKRLHLFFKKCSIQARPQGYFFFHTFTQSADGEVFAASQQQKAQNLKEAYATHVWFIRVLD